MVAESRQPVIVHLTTAHPCNDNRIYAKECTALARAGLDVVLVAPDTPAASAGPVPRELLRRRTSRWRRLLLGQSEAWRTLRRLQPAMLHVHDPELIPLAVLWRWRHRRPAVYDAHEDLPRQIHSKSYLPAAVRPAAILAAWGLERMADRFLSGVVAATAHIAAKYRRPTIVQNFPWIDAFPQPAERTETGDDVVYVGALTGDRGVHEMLALADDLPDGSRLVLAGAATPDVAELIDAATGPSLAYLGKVEPSAVPAITGAAGVGLALLHPVPNYLEAQSTKIYEYMAAGIPFVASDFPSWRRQLGPHECGLFVDPLDSEAVRAAVAGLLDDLDVRRDMGRRGRRALEDNFTFDAEATRLVELSRRLTGLLGRTGDEGPR